MNQNQRLKEFKFPSDIADKGNEMVKAYYNLYLIENFLRLFIENVATNKFGSNYWEKLKIGKDICKKVEFNKKKEEKKKWLSLRGDSNLFYTNFDDLRQIFSANWLGLFESYFEKEIQITYPLEQLYILRNRVAHNSYLDKNEQDILKTYCNQIYRQLSGNLSYLDEIELEFKPEKQNNLFTEFKKLVYSKNFKKIIIKWTNFNMLFYNDAFHVRPQMYKNITGGMISISHVFDRSTLRLDYDDQGHFYCSIKISEDLAAKDTDDNFIEVAKEFFKNIEDSITNYP